jgi:hypothetical protein
MLGCGAIAWGMIGMFFTSNLESGLGLKPTEEDKENLKKIIPSMRTMDRDQKGASPSTTPESKP